MGKGPVTKYSHASLTPGLAPGLGPGCIIRGDVTALVICLLSDLSPRTSLPWENRPGAEALDSITEVIQAFKLPQHSKTAFQGGVFVIVYILVLGRTYDIISAISA